MVSIFPGTNLGCYTVFQEQNAVSEDGKTVLEESATDKDCRAQVMKAKFDDDTVNTIINDLDGVCQKQRDLFLSFSLPLSFCVLTTTQQLF